MRRILVVLALVLCASPSPAEPQLPPGAVLRLGRASMIHGYYRDMAFTPDGKQLLVVIPVKPTPEEQKPGEYYDKYAVRVIDVGTGQVVHESPPFVATQHYVDPVLSPDASLVSWTQRMSDRVVLHDSRTGKRIDAVAPPDKVSRFDSNVVFSPEGKIVLVHLDESVVIWDRTTGEVTKPPLVSCQLVSADGRMLVGYAFTDAGPADPQRKQARKGDFVLLERATGKVRQVFAVGDDGRTPGAISPDGQLVTFRDKEVEARSTATGRRAWVWRPKKEARLPNGYFHPAIFSPDGRFVAFTDAEHVLHVLDAASGAPLAELKGHPANSPPAVLVFSHDSKLLASGGGWGELILWDLFTGTRIAPDSAPPVRAVAWSPKGKLIAAGAGLEVRLWDTTTGQEAGSLRTDEGGFSSLAFSADGKTLASAGSERVRLWDVEARKQTREVTFTGTFPFTDLAFAPGGGFLLGRERLGGASNLEVWDLTADVESFTRRGTTGPACWAPDGEGVAYFQTNRFKTALDLRLWDVRGKSTGSTAFPDRELLVPAGKLLPRRFDRGVELWDVRTGKLATTLPPGNEDESAQKLSNLEVALSPDGKLLAFYPWEGSTIEVWDVTTRKKTHTFAGHPGATTALAFAPDGAHLASGGRDGSVFVWDLTGKSTLRPQARQVEDDPAALWADLASDATAAHRAGHRLSTMPDKALPLLRTELAKEPAPLEKRVRKLITALDSDTVETRDRAEKELTEVGKPAEELIRLALRQEGISEEGRRRLQGVLTHFPTGFPPPVDLQRRRAVKVLERIGSDDAKRLLQSIITADPLAQVAVEARAAPARMSKLGR